MYGTIVLTDNREKNEKWLPMVLRFLKAELNKHKLEPLMLLRFDERGGAGQSNQKPGGRSPAAQGQEQARSSLTAALPLLHY